MVKRPATRIDDNDDNDNGDVKTVRKIDPLIRSLLHHLPASGSVWPPQDRQHWITMLQNAFQVVYKDAEPIKPGAPGAPTPPGRPV